MIYQMNQELSNLKKFSEIALLMNHNIVLHGIPGDFRKEGAEGRAVS